MMITKCIETWSQLSWSKAKNYWYYEDDINNIKSTWKGTKSIISIHKMTNESPKLISLADQTVTDPQAIANTFNSFNFSVAPEFQSKLSFLYLPGPNQDSLFISHCTKEEII